MDEEPINIEEAIANLVKTFSSIIPHAHDLAYARRTLYLAYLTEGFNPDEALELCKIV